MATLLGDLPDGTDGDFYSDVAVTEQHKFHRLFEGSHDAILIITAEGEIVNANAAARDLFGYDQHEFFGMNAQHLVADSNGPVPLTPDHVVEGGVIGFEAHLQTKRGRDIVGSLSLTVCPAAVPSESLLLCIIHDVTQEHHLKRELLGLQEDERRRIGRELHDGVGSQLVGAITRLDRCIRLLEEDKEVSADQLRLIRDGVVQSAEEIRDLSHGLNPMRLGPTYLTSALNELADRMSSESVVPCTFEGPDDDPDITGDEATHLYRIAQEATSNALKHSDATAIHIRLTTIGTHLRLEICDNGQGFDPSLDVHKSLGFRSMRYRTELMGGQFEVDSTPETGTRIRVELPVGE